MRSSPLVAQAYLTTEIPKKVEATDADPLTAHDIALFATWETSRRNPMTVAPMAERANGTSSASRLARRTRIQRASGRSRGMNASRTGCKDTPCNGASVRAVFRFDVPLR
jgi:hypothetical protein